MECPYFVTANKIKLMIHYLTPESNSGSKTFYYLVFGYYTGYLKHQQNIWLVRLATKKCIIQYLNIDLYRSVAFCFIINSSFDATGCKYGFARAAEI